MADKLKAINKFRPKIKKGRTAGMKEVVNYIADKTGFTKGSLYGVLYELSEAVIFFNQQGRAINIEGLGIYTPEINTKGRFLVSHKVSKDILQELNRPGAFHGTLLNKSNVGKTTEEFIRLWNKENPGDKVIK